MDNTVSKLMESQIIGPSAGETVYVATTHEDTGGICEYLGIYEGDADLVKEKVGELYNRDPDKIELILVSGDNFSARYTKI